MGKGPTKAEFAQRDFLNEHNLGKLLLVLYPKSDFVRDRQVAGSGCKMRPDFQCKNLKMLVEFDGFGHYTKSEDVFLDQMKDEHFGELGYTIVRIPYFVQPCASTIKTLFGLDLEYPQKYKHGFHDDNVKLPADFCAAGFECFVRDLERFSDIKLEILASLQPWVEKLGHKDRVLPRCIQHLLS